MLSILLCAICLVIGLFAGMFLGIYAWHWLVLVRNNDKDFYDMIVRYEGIREKFKEK